MINAGKYNRRIKIVLPTKAKDKDGFPVESEPELILTAWASIKTTRGFTLIVNNTDFDKAFVNFTIRYPSTPIDRDMLILYGGKTYEIQYLNNINEAFVELEIQAKEVTH